MTAAVGATALLGGTVSPAQADTGHFTDATGDAYAWTSNGPRYDNPEADIVRYELSVTDAAVSASVFLSTWDRSKLDTSFVGAAIDTNSDTVPEYILAKYAREDGDPSAGLTALFRVVDVTQDGSYDLDVVDCAVLFGFSSATHGVSLSSPASCLGSPASARVSVVVATGYDDREAEDVAPDGIDDFSPEVLASIADVTAPVAVHRFWSPKFNNAHFFTTSATEAASIQQYDTNWVYEGEAFSTYPADGETCTGGTSPVYRFYSARFQSHFFTINASEKASIVAGDRNWTYEGVAYCASTDPLPGSTPLYRFWSPGFGKHHFTADAGEAHQLDVNDPNWNAEGIAYYVIAP